MYRSSFLVIFLSIFLIVPGVKGQSVTIQGLVEDAAKAPVAGAVVVLRNQSTGLERLMNTDAGGNFSFGGLSTARYELTARANGFAVRTLTVEGARSGIVLILDPEILRASVTVFSGSRQAELQESLNTAVEVVTRKDIESKGYRTVGEILKEVPGVQTRLGSDTGTVSGVAGEQVQGIGSRQALVLIDGFPVIAARGIKSGTINLDRQSTGKIEQIEVVQGAASALYGSDAIGGVINMIGREPSKAIEGSFTLSGGNIGVLSESAEFGLRRKAYSGYFSFSRDKQNEFDLTPTTFDTTGAGFHRYDLFGKQKWEFSPRFYISALTNVYTGHALGRSIGEPDPTLNFQSGQQFDNTRDITQNYGLTANWTPTSKTVIQARGYFSRYDEYSRTSFSNGRTFPDDNLFQRFGRLDASILQIWGERQIIQAGGEWSTDRYRGLNRLANNAGERADTKTAWGQDKISLTNWATLTLGIRYDAHSIFGSAISPKIGINIRANDRINLRASWGRGFRAPDLGQLYYKFYNPTNFYQVFGNPRLKPEHSGSWQVGAEYMSTKKNYRFGFNLFRNDVVNLIDPFTVGFVLPFPSPGALTIGQAYAYISGIGLDPAQYPILPFRLLIVYNNISKIFTQGVETNADVKLPGNFSASGSYTYLDARNKANGEYLPERFKHQGFLKLAYDNDKYGFRANVRASLYSNWKASSQSNRALQGELASPAFQLFDVYASKTIRKGVDVFGSIENIFNNKDANVGKFGTNGQPLPILRPDAGRMFRIGLRLSLSRDK
jgi:outer membrane receptor for ferrienterochelin and colicins